MGEVFQVRVASNLRTIMMGIGQLVTHYFAKVMCTFMCQKLNMLDDMKTLA